MNLQEIKNILIKNKEAYLYDLLSSIKVVFSTKISTMCVNKYYVMTINPNFIDKLSEKELVFCIFHEAMHLIYGHVHSKPTNPELANMAMDIFINEELVFIGYTCPSFGLLKKTYNVPNELYTTKEIYKWLEENLPEEEKKVIIMVNTEELSDINQTEKDYEEQESQLSPEDKQDIEDIIETLRDYLEDKVKETSNIQEEEVIPWDIDLTTEIGRLIRREIKHNYSRPARYEPKGIIRPCHYINTLVPKINLYIDKSGSMEENYIKVVSSLLAIKQKLKQYTPTYYVFDTSVSLIEESELLSIVPSGGTEFKNIIGLSDLHVIITDGELDFSYIDSQKNVVTYLIKNNTISKRLV